MAKPICIVKVHESSISTSKHISVLQEFQTILDDRLNDYHVLVVPLSYSNYSGIHEPIQVQVFYEKDFTEIQYQELKKMIAESLPKKPI